VCDILLKLWTNCLMCAIKNVQPVNNRI